MYPVRKPSSNHPVSGLEARYPVRFCSVRNSSSDQGVYSRSFVIRRCCFQRGCMGHTHQGLSMSEKFSTIVSFIYVWYVHAIALHLHNQLPKSFTCIQYYLFFAHFIPFHTNANVYFVLSGTWHNLSCIDYFLSCTHYLLSGTPSSISVPFALIDPWRPIIPL